MAKTDRTPDNGYTCIECFADPRLSRWIAEHGQVRGRCAWCGSVRSPSVSLRELGPSFRAAVRMYKPNLGDDPFWAGRGELIGTLLQDDWQTFSEEMETKGSLQDLAVAILQAGLTKDDVDEPDYTDLFLQEDPLDHSVDDEWEKRVRDLLTPAPRISHEELEALAEEGIFPEESYDRLEYILREMATAIIRATYFSELAYISKESVIRGSNGMSSARHLLIASSRGAQTAKDNLSCTLQPIERRPFQKCGRGRVPQSR